MTTTTPKEKTTPERAFKILCDTLEKKPDRQNIQKFLMAHLATVTGSRAALPLYHKTFCSACDAKAQTHCESCGKERLEMYRVMVTAMMKNDYSILQGQGQAKAADKKAEVPIVHKEVATQTTTAEPPPEETTDEVVTLPRRGVKPKQPVVMIENDGDDELTKLLIRRLTPHLPTSGTVDEDRVKEIVTDELANSHASARSDFKDLALDVVRHALSNGEFPVDRVKQIIQEALAGTVSTINVVRPDHTSVNVGRQHYKFPLIMAAINARVPFLLVGPAGSSKTSAVETAFKSAGLTFEAISVGPMTSKADLFGFIDAAGHYHETSTVRQATQGGGMLWDELDAGNAGVLTYGNMLLSNGHVALPTGMRDKHADFCMAGTANTYGMGANRVYVGRNQIDGATLDRFAVIDWDYDEGFEASLIGVHKASPTLTIDEGGITSPDEWLAHLIKVRHCAERLGVRHIISPRATINGVKLFTAGVGRKHVEEMVLWKGLDKETRQKITTALPAAL